MASTSTEAKPAFLLKRILIDFDERPLCQRCQMPMIICSHSSPSKVVGLEGIYYTEYREYTCGDTDCSQYRRKKYRAPNPWRTDRHKYDHEVEAEVARQRFKEKRTYQEIETMMVQHYGIKISQKTIGNILRRYEIICELEQHANFENKFKPNGGVFIGIDAMAPLKGEDKHIVAIDHFTQQPLLVERIKSENTETHVAFQKNLKKLLRHHKIKVLGFMSDDHVAQRNAIQKVWGPHVKHCRCLFHFQKRILLETFKLNSKLKTKAKARIRRIHYVKFFREEKLDPIEHSPVWEYLVEILKDLVALQEWKNKRNDTDLESIAFYKRLVDIYHLLTALKRRLASTAGSSISSIETRLDLLTRDVKAILGEFQRDYEALVQIKSYQNELKQILEAHEESSQIGLDMLVLFAEKLEVRLKNNTITCEAEKYYIQQLCSFVYDRGKSLFQYRDIDHASNTNNPQELKFKTLKHTLRRTQGMATGPHYFQHHAKSLLYVDPDSSREEIRQMLVRADHKKVAQIMKEEQARRKRPLSRIKNEKKWAARKKKLKEKLQEI